VSTANEDRYELVLARSAIGAPSETLPEKIALAVFAFIPGPLLENPHLVGKPMRDPLAPAYSARRGSYRVLYVIDDAKKTVSVTAIAPEMMSIARIFSRRSKA
jgi:mRNA interferase RelE/StbE